MRFTGLFSSDYSISPTPNPENPENPGSDKSQNPNPKNPGSYFRVCKVFVTDVQFTKKTSLFLL